MTEPYDFDSAPDINSIDWSGGVTRNGPRDLTRYRLSQLTQTVEALRSAGFELPNDVDLSYRKAKRASFEPSEKNLNDALVKLSKVEPGIRNHEAYEKAAMAVAAEQAKLDAARSDTFQEHLKRVQFIQLRDSLYPVVDGYACKAADAANEHTAKLTELLPNLPDHNSTPTYRMSRGEMSLAVEIGELAELVNAQWRVIQLILNNVHLAELNVQDRENALSIVFQVGQPETIGQAVNAADELVRAGTSVKSDPVALWWIIVRHHITLNIAGTKWEADARHEELVSG